MSSSSNSFQERLLEKFLIRNDIDIDIINNALNEILELNGAIAVSLVDWESEIILSSISKSDLDIDLASNKNNSVVKAVVSMVSSINSKEIKDMVVLLKNQIHISTYIDGNRGFFLYLILDAQKTNLALARSRVDIIVDRLKYRKG